MLGADPVPGKRRAYPSNRCPKARSGRMRSQTILAIASSGIASTAPSTPHIQYQNISPSSTATGFTVKRRARIIGVMSSPSATWMPR